MEINDTRKVILSSRQVRYTLYYLHDLCLLPQHTRLSHCYALNSPCRFGKVQGSGQTTYTSSR